MIYRPFLNDEMLINGDFRNWNVAFAYGVPTPKGHTSDEMIPNTIVCQCASLHNAQLICYALNRILDGDQNDD